MDIPEALTKIYIDGILERIQRQNLVEKAIILIDFRMAESNSSSGS